MQGDCLDHSHSELEHQEDRVKKEIKSIWENSFLELSDDEKEKSDEREDWYDEYVDNGSDVLWEEGGGGVDVESIEVVGRDSG